jgi:proline iminopeptidase
MTPDEHTNQELMLGVSHGHTLYVQDWGKKDAAVPIISLHGGPGGSVTDAQRGPFDPRSQRVIFFDQRGCGKSTPYGSLEHNTTADLVADIDAVADKLGISRFIITGGSWGSCLALAYAVARPERVFAMVLRGIFTGSQKEIEWLDKGQFQTFFPDVWEQYKSFTPEPARDDPSQYHFERALGKDKATAKQSAYAYENVERALVKLDDRFVPEVYDSYDPSGIQIEIAYLKNRCFMPDRFILENASKLTMPVWLIQGRYDMVCPPITAYELSKQLPQGHLIWTISGHKDEHETWTLIRSLLQQLTTSR